MTQSESLTSLELGGLLHLAAKLDEKSLLALAADRTFPYAAEARIILGLRHSLEATRRTLKRRSKAPNNLRMQRGGA